MTEKGLPHNAHDEKHTKEVLLTYTKTKLADEHLVSWKEHKRCKDNRFCEWPPRDIEPLLRQLVE